MVLRDKVVIKCRGYQKEFIFQNNEYDWNNVIEITENTYAKLSLVGSYTSKLYLDGVNVLLLEAESKNELDKKNSNRYYVDNDGAYVNFTQEEITLFDTNHPIFKDTYMDHTLFPGYYRLMLVNSETEKYFAWLKIKPKQLNVTQLDNLKNDLESTIQGLAKRFDRNHNGLITFKKEISQKNLDVIELLYNEKKNFDKSIYYITNNPKYEIQSEHNLMVKSTNFRNHGNINKNHFHIKRNINYDLKSNKILKFQLNFLLKKVNYLINIIYNYIYNKKEKNDIFKDELSTLKKYKYTIINFLDNDWISSIDYSNLIETNNNVSNVNYLFINNLINKINSAKNEKISFSRQYTYYYHRTDVLYEVWAFVKVIETLNKLGFIPKEGWIFSENRKSFGELTEGETVISFFDNEISEITNKNCKYVKIIYDKLIKNKDAESHVKMALGYTHNRPDIRVEFYDNENKIISLVIMDTKYRNYKSIFYRTKKNSTLKQFIEYVNGIEIKEEYKSNAVKKMEEISGQTSLKNSLFILYPMFSDEKPPIIGEDNQYRINLIPNDKNIDLYECLREQISKMNNYFNYL